MLAREREGGFLERKKGSEWRKEKEKSCWRSPGNSRATLVQTKTPSKTTWFEGATEEAKAQAVGVPSSAPKKVHDQNRLGSSGSRGTRRTDDSWRHQNPSWVKAKLNLSGLVPCLPCSSVATPQCALSGAATRVVTRTKAARGRALAREGASSPMVYSCVSLVSRGCSGAGRNPEHSTPMKGNSFFTTTTFLENSGQYTCSVRRTRCE